MKRFVGTGVALVTPFNGNLHIDRESLISLVNHVIEGGVDFLVALGTTAETATLTPEEKEEVVGIISEVNRGRLPLMVGMGGNNTEKVIQEIRQAEWLEQCQGILCITPFYNKPTQDGIYEHFKAIASVSPLPLCLYNVPGRTGVNMQAETLARLSRECPNIIAVKEASGNFGQATSILKLKRSDFIALSGDDSIVLPLMSMGFEGVVSVVANVLPRQCAALVNSVREKDYEKAQRLHIALSDLYTLLFAEGNPAGIKAALHAAGIIRSNALRLPLVPAGEKLYAEIRTAVAGVSSQSM